MKIKQILFFLFIINAYLFSSERISTVEHWEYPDETFFKIYYSLVDQEEQLVAGFFKTPLLSMSLNKIDKFAPYGQGPNDLINVVGMCLYKGNLAVAERSDKIKIYINRNGKYNWKETKWLKSDNSFNVVTNIAFISDKWFLAGVEHVKYKNNKMHFSFLKVCDENGKIIKRLIRKTFSKPNQLHLMNYYIPTYGKNKVFFLSENALEVFVVLSDKLEIEKRIKLKTPPFYKIMPDNFYVWKKYNNPKDNILNDIESWNMGYSKITNALVDGKYLIIQIRTCNTDLKKFALLFYNANNFKLEKTFFTDDFLMGVKNGKLYCFSNGDPGRDDDTDKCVINILEITEK